MYSTMEDMMMVVRLSPCYVLVVSHYSWLATIQLKYFQNKMVACQKSSKFKTMCDKRKMKTNIGDHKCKM